MQWFRRQYTHRIHLFSVLLAFVWADFGWTDTEVAISPVVECGPQFRGLRPPRAPGLPSYFPEEVDPYALTQVGQSDPERKLVSALGVNPATFDLSQRKASVANAIQTSYPGYQVTHLASGGEGIVFLVADENRGDSKVIKAMKAPGNGRSIHSFNNEPVIHEAIQRADAEGAKHVLVAPETSAIEVNNWAEPVLHLKWASGGDLKAALEKFTSEATPEDMLRAWREIALGVRALHRAGIVHRDIKPGNILLHKEANDPSHRLFVSDMGMALFLDGERNFPTSLVGGSFPYMSANQSDGKPPSFQDDTFALRVTFMEMLEGAPYHNQTVTLSRKAKERFPSPLVNIASTWYGSVDDLIAAIDAAASHFPSPRTLSH